MADSAQFYQAFNDAPLDSPQRVRGFFLRADLDGFTKRVKAAFAAGPAAIQRLVKEFCETMDIPDSFDSKLNDRKMKMIQLPWAGDCFNAIIFPAQFGDYSSARGVLPFNAPYLWHTSTSSQSRKWAVGIAGGGEDEGNGAILIVPIRVSGRTFNIAASWSAGRSLKAQENYPGPELTSLPEEDYGLLEPCFRAVFKGENSFRVAKLAAMRKAKEKLHESMKSHRPAVTPCFGVVTPKPKPHYENISRTRPNSSY